MEATIKLGSKGSDVKKLQRALHLYEDGIFGKLTEESLKKFQSNHGLTPDGVCGKITWQIINGDDESDGLKKSTRKITKIILHCSATLEGKDYTVEDITKWHKQRGYSTIGYHYVIYRDGSIHEGRNINVSGAHTEGHNSNSIGICYIGGCGKSSNEAKDTRTPQQKESLTKLVKALIKKYNLKPTDVYGHYQFANKACPSFKIEPLRTELA